jgi:putative SOS response-associated peptidase YedK
MTAAPTIDPGQLDRIIRARPDGSREALDSYWGLLPAWTGNRNGAGRPINARAETLMETVAFRPLVRSNRCAIAVTAFYEWAPTPTGRRRIAIRRRDGRGIALAGLWRSGIDRATGEPITSHVLITCEPNRFMAAFHHRMPVVLDGDALDAWLDPKVRAPAAVLPLLVPCADDLLVADDPAARRTRPQAGGDQLAFAL